MGLIDIIKLSNIEENYCGYVENQTRGHWVRGKNTSSVLHRPPEVSIFGLGDKVVAQAVEHYIFNQSVLCLNPTGSSSLESIALLKRE